MIFSACGRERGCCHATIHPRQQWSNCAVICDAGDSAPLPLHIMHRPFVVQFGVRMLPRGPSAVPREPCNAIDSAMSVDSEQQNSSVDALGVILCNEQYAVGISRAQVECMHLSKERNT